MRMMISMLLFLPAIVLAQWTNPPGPTNPPPGFYVDPSTAGHMSGGGVGAEVDPYYRAGITNYYTRLEIDAMFGVTNSLSTELTNWWTQAGVNASNLTQAVNVIKGRTSVWESAYVTATNAMTNVLNINSQTAKYDQAYATVTNSFLNGIYIGPEISNLTGQITYSRGSFSTVKFSSIEGTNISINGTLSLGLELYPGTLRFYNGGRWNRIMPHEYGDSELLFHLPITSGMLATRDRVTNDILSAQALLTNNPSGYLRTSNIWAHGMVNVDAGINSGSGTNIFGCTSFQGPGSWVYFQNDAYILPTNGSSGSQIWRGLDGVATFPVHSNLQGSIIYGFINAKTASVGRVLDITGEYSSAGRIRFYNQGYWNSIVPNGNGDDTLEFALPISSGTFALLSDATNIAQSAIGGVTGSVYITSNALMQVITNLALTRAKTIGAVMSNLVHIGTLNQQGDIQMATTNALKGTTVENGKLILQSGFAPALDSEIILNSRDTAYGGVDIRLSDYPYALFRVQKNDGTTLFSVSCNGESGFGGNVLQNGSLDSNIVLKAGVVAESSNGIPSLWQLQKACQMPAKAMSGPLWLMVASCRLIKVNRSALALVSSSTAMTPKAIASASRCRQYPLPPLPQHRPVKA